MIKQIISDLYKLDRKIMGEGYNQALEYINNIIPLKIYDFPTGIEVGTWKVPQEWIAKEAWVKFRGKKIIDLKNNPLHLLGYSLPFQGKVKLEELKKHFWISDERPDAIPYECRFYERNWGFCVSKNWLFEKPLCENGVCHPELKSIDPEIGKVKIEGQKEELKCKLKEGEYEIFIDTEFRDGIMKVGEHIIKGSSDREIIIAVHLDHPYQANDNLSAVAMAIDLAGKLKCNHTIKIIFCPETIGSIVYALTQDLSKVDFMIGAECVGGREEIYIKKSFDERNLINYWLHLAVAGKGIDNKRGQFRTMLGGEEYVFSDPQLGIPSILITRFLTKHDSPYPEYHTSDDTPDIIKEGQIEKVEQVIMNLIDIAEKDFVPIKGFRGPLFRSRFGVQIPNKQYCRQMDYLFYLIDGQRSLAQIVSELGLNFQYTYELCKKLQAENLLLDFGKKRQQAAGK